MPGIRCSAEKHFTFSFSAQPRTIRSSIHPKPGRWDSPTPRIISLRINRTPTNSHRLGGCDSGGAMRTCGAGRNCGESGPPASRLSHSHPHVSALPGLTALRSLVRYLLGGGVTLFMAHVSRPLEVAVRSCRQCYIVQQAWVVSAGLWGAARGGARFALITTILA
ncbi:hypothetical protein Tco_1282590 [Tanacetum coccineum]